MSSSAIKSLNNFSAVANKGEEKKQFLQIVKIPNWNGKFEQVPKFEPVSLIKTFDQQ